ncbi:MAG: hypothetical protein JO019_00175 [Candidatus Kaiserbacteria bacterium]|nr:hypothetical protein [Candidatus Kaiserbacteria bacterium]
MISETVALAISIGPYLWVHTNISDPNFHDMTVLEGILVGVGMFVGTPLGMFLLDRLSEWALKLPDATSGPEGPQGQGFSPQAVYARLMRSLRQLGEWNSFAVFFDVMAANGILFVVLAKYVNTLSSGLAALAVVIFTTICCIVILASSLEPRCRAAPA